MKTFNQIKTLIGFCQTDEFFLEYLQMLQAAGVIHVNDGDIDADGKNISEDFYDCLASVYGIEPEQQTEDALWQQD